MEEIEQLKLERDGLLSLTNSTAGRLAVAEIELARKQEAVASLEKALQRSAELARNALRERDQALAVVEALSRQRQVLPGRQAVKMLADASLRMPKLRLGQLISNAIGGRDLFHIDDDKLTNFLFVYVAKSNGRD